jgi:hypothetical protein
MEPEDMSLVSCFPRKRAAGGEPAQQAVVELVSALSYAAHAVAPGVDSIRPWKETIMRVGASDMDVLVIMQLSVTVVCVCGTTVAAG